MTDDGQSFNRTLLRLLTKLHEFLDKDNKSPFTIVKDSIRLIHYGKELIHVTPYDIKIAGESFQSKLKGIAGSDSTDLPEKYMNFIKAIPGGIEVDHVGISYWCDDMDTEKVRIKELAASKGIPVHEEPNEEVDQQWVFLGNPKAAPMCEMVLNRGLLRADEWRPHFQIDMNTKLSIDEIKSLTDTYLHPNFIHWELDIPQVGVVLGMGILGEVDGTKIALGLGTSKRNTAFARELTFKKLD